MLTGITIPAQSGPGNNNDEGVFRTGTTTSNIIFKTPLSEGVLTCSKGQSQLIPRPIDKAHGKNLWEDNSRQDICFDVKRASLKTPKAVSISKSVKIKPTNENFKVIFMLAIPSNLART